MLHDIGQRGKEDELQLAHGACAQRWQHRQGRHGPHQGQPHGVEPGLQPVAQIGQQGRDIARRQIQCIDGQLQLVQRITQGQQDLVVVGLPGLQLADGSADVGAHAIVHVAQDAGALQLALVLLDGRDVGHQHHVVAAAPGAIRHGADAEHGGEHATALALAQGLARPETLTLQRLAHGGQMPRPLARGQHGGQVLAQHVATTVSRHAQEGVVHLDEAEIGIQDADALTRVREEAGHQLQLALRLLALADVAQRDVNGRLAVVDDGGSLHLHVEGRAIEPQEARLHHGFYRLLGNYVVHPLRLLGQEIGVDQLAGALARQLRGTLRAKGPHRGRVHIQDLAQPVHQHRLRRQLHQRAKSLLALAQLAAQGFVGCGPARACGMRHIAPVRAARSAPMDARL